MSKMREMYDEAAQLLTKARNLLEDGGNLTDQQKEEINRWISQSDEIRQKAEQLTRIADAELEIIAAEEQETLDKNKEDDESKAKDANFPSFPEFLMSIARMRKGQGYDPRLEALEQKDLAGEQGTLGGFTIAPDFRAEVLSARAEGAIVRSRARIVPMGSRTVEFPAVDVSGGATGVSAFFGGVTVAYTDENVNINESQPAFKAIELHLRELAGYAEIPNGLLRDSAISLEAFLSGPGSFGGALGWQEDFDFLNGNGVGKPLGVLNADALDSVTRATANEVNIADVVNMKSNMLMTGGGSPVWVINQSVMPQLYQMESSGGGQTWIANLGGAGPETLLGWPIIWTEKLPVLGTASDIMLIDFSAYLLGDGQSVTIDIDTSFKFQANQTAFRIVEAIDGQPWINAVITLADGSTTVSPFVSLAA